MPDSSLADHLFLISPHRSERGQISEGRASLIKASELTQVTGLLTSAVFTEASPVWTLRDLPSLPCSDILSSSRKKGI